MSEEEIAKALNDLKELSMTNYYGDTYFTEQAGTKLALKYIEKLQKENKESKELYNKLLTGYNKLVQEYLELEKVIDLIIDDFQMENYFVGMTNKEIREYYKKRKELKE